MTKAGMGWLTAAVLAAVSVSGCGNFIRSSSSSDSLRPYSSEVTLSTKGEAKVEYEVLGEGKGESTGFYLLCGLIMAAPDKMDAIDMAIKSLGGDVLLDIREQKLVSGFAPIVLIRTIKVRGFVA